jgi:hypothetical protein
MSTQETPPSGLSDAHLADIRKAIASIDATIESTRTARTATNADGSARPMASRRADRPWWMKRAG